MMRIGHCSGNRRNPRLAPISPANGAVGQTQGAPPRKPNKQNPQQQKQEIYREHRSLSGKVPRAHTLRLRRGGE